MSTSEIPTASGSHLMPSFGHAHVSDVMRLGVITCPPETSLVTVARMMAAHHVHAVVITSAEADRGEVAWGVVSDRELLRAGERAEEMSAGEAAATDFASVTAEDTLQEAGKRMLAHGSAHAVVVEQGAGRPVGMVSSLDVAGVIAWGRA